jgi:hypothetical protein
MEKAQCRQADPHLSGGRQPRRAANRRDHELDRLRRDGDDVSQRLAQHARSEGQGGKDFWDRAVVLTNKDANLTKAHARYLESRFITLARQAGRSRLTNGTSPLPLPLPEADVSDMEYFIAQAKIILPVLSVNIFRSASSPAGASAETADASPRAASPVFTLCLRSARSPGFTISVPSGSVTTPVTSVVWK